MNVLIFEYITGGGMIGEALPASLVKEGELMLNAVAGDFAAVHDVTVSIMLDHRLQSASQFKHRIIVDAKTGYEEAIENHVNEIDAMLIIAPETENVLHDLCAKYSEYNFILLNSNLESIALAADKYETYLLLEKYAINQVPTFLQCEIDKITSNKMIAKPRDGVGCENILITDKSNDLLELNIPNEYIFQPYIQGKHLSLSLICWEEECLLLTVNQQFLVEENNTFALERCVVNDLPREPFDEFSKKLSSVFTGLKGYIGVDLLIANEEMYLVEINPRLTTSYVGIHSAIDINPAQLILKTFLEKKLPALKLQNNKSVAIDIGDVCAA